jgi:acetylornithine deacetylase/succinyl-diaminopimelate desuccinylase-like protein
MPGATDGRFFSRLGIQSYGFIPMQLPDSFDFSRLIHAANERIPIKALDFGALCMYTLLRDYRNIATSRIVNNA